MSCVATHDFLACIEGLEYPKKILLLLDEQYILFGRLQLTLQQDQPYSIHQRKLLNADFRKDMELRYETCITYRHVECTKVVQDNEQQKHLL
jgi:hypothetical protein